MRLGFRGHLPAESPSAAKGPLGFPGLRGQAVVGWALRLRCGTVGGLRFPGGQEVAVSQPCWPETRPGPPPREASSKGRKSLPASSHLPRQVCPDLPRFPPGQGRKLFAQTIVENVGKNQELIGFLNGALKQQMRELNLALKVRRRQALGFSRLPAGALWER